MKHRELPVEKLKEYLYYDPIVGVLINKKKRGKCAVGDFVGGPAKHNKQYWVVGFNSQPYYFSRVCWAIYHGVSPSGQIDHVNGDRADNRIENLRECSHHQNQFNKKGRSKRFMKGVSLDNYGYRAKISFSGKSIHIGRFVTEHDAHEAYCLKAKELHGEFSRFE